MSVLPKVVLVLGILAIVAGVAFVALDLLGRGDSSGADPKDLGIIVVGIVLVAVGLVLGRRPKPEGPSPTNSPPTP